MPVILADIGGILAVAFLLISFIGWIINLINAQNPPPAPNRGPQRRPRARDGKVQNEIEQFLQEAMGSRGNKHGNNRGGGGRKDAGSEDVKVLEPAPQRRAPQRRRPQTQVRAESSTASGERPSRQSDAAPANAAPAVLAPALTPPPPEHVRERIADQVETHLPHAVNQGVIQHLGSFAGMDSRSSGQSASPSRAAISNPAGFLGELRTRDGMRKAILLQEILARPRALRK